MKHIHENIFDPENECDSPCPWVSVIANVDGKDFVIDGFAKYKGYGDECKTIYFAGFALFQDVGKNLVFSALF